MDGGRLFGFGSGGAGQLGVNVQSVAVSRLAKESPAAARIVAAAGATAAAPRLDAVALPVEVGWWELPPGSRVSRVACGWRHTAVVYDAPAGSTANPQTPAAAGQPEPESEEVESNADSDSWFGWLSDEILIEKILLPEVLGCGLKIFDAGAALQPGGVTNGVVDESWVPKNKMLIVRDLGRLARVCLGALH